MKSCRGDGQPVRPLVFLLPLLTVVLVALALLVASSSSRHRDDDDGSTPHDLDAVSLDETGGLPRAEHVQPAELPIQPVKFPHPGARYVSEAMVPTPGAASTRGSSTESTPQAGDDSVAGTPMEQPSTDYARATVVHGSGMTSSSTSALRSTSPARTLGPEEEAVLVSVRALLSAMQATSTTSRSSPSRFTSHGPGNLVAEDAVEGDGISDEHESTERLKEGIRVQDEEDFRKTHEELDAGRQLPIIAKRDA